MANFDSDYSVRLATLEALGGDVTKCYDSVYAIDLAILAAIQGGGGGMDYNQMKQLLAASGVTEILFTGNGSGETVTLDYDLISQIGQGGGGDYICVDSVEALSGITDPKDGMLAYVGAYVTQEERMVISADFYGAEWFNADMDFGNDVTARFGFHDNGNNANVSNGHFKRNNDGWFWEIPRNRGDLPTDFVYNNGVQGTLVSNVNGGEYAEHNEYLNTIWIEKYNGVFPTVTFETNGAVTVATSVTVETVSVYHRPKGCWRYYADANKWLGYDNIYMDDLTNAELQTLLNEYVQYGKPFGVYWVVDDNSRYIAKGNACQFSNDTIKFASVPTNNTSDNYRIWSRRYTYNNGEWQNDVNNNIQIPSFEDIEERLSNRIYTISKPYGGIDTGGLYNVGVNETVSGVTISTTIDLDATATSENHIATIYNRNSGRGNWEQLSEDGWLFTNKGGISASTSPEWFVIDYSATWDGNLNKMVTYIAAAKIEDNGDNTFTVTYFLGSDTWDGSEWYDNRGYTDYYEFYADNDRGYTWTVTEHQTLTVTPHLYTQIRFEHGDNSNARYIHPLVSHKTTIMTEAEYQSLSVKDPNTIYYLTSN